MSTFFVPGIPARSVHPGVFEELQNDGEGQEVFYFTWRPQKKIEILIFLKRYIFHINH